MHVTAETDKSKLKHQTAVPFSFNLRTGNKFGCSRNNISDLFLETSQGREKGGEQNRVFVATNWNEDNSRLHVGAAPLQ